MRNKFLMVDLHIKHWTIMNWITKQKLKKNYKGAHLYVITVLRLEFISLWKKREKMKRRSEAVKIWPCRSYGGLWGFYLSWSHHWRCQKNRETGDLQLNFFDLISIAWCGCMKLVECVFEQWNRGEIYIKGVRTIIYLEDEGVKEGV